MLFLIQHLIYVYRLRILEDSVSIFLVNFVYNGNESVKKDGVGEW